MIKTAVLSGFLPLFYAIHMYTASPLHVAARLQDLTWRGNKVMQSEETMDSKWVKYLGWIIVSVESLFIVCSSASPVRGLKFLQCFHIHKSAFIVVILAPQFLMLTIGSFLMFQNMFKSAARFLTQHSEVSTSSPLPFRTGETRRALARLWHRFLTRVRTITGALSIMAAAKSAMLAAQRGAEESEKATEKTAKLGMALAETGVAKEILLSAKFEALKDTNARLADPDVDVTTKGLLVHRKEKLETEITILIAGGSSINAAEV